LVRHTICPLEDTGLNQQVSNQLPFPRGEKRIHVALPIRVTYWDRNNQPCLDLACTYDISAHGARVTGLRFVKEAGEIIAVERGRSKAFCRVVWVGEPNSELRGQVGIQCVEAQRGVFESEVREMGEIYEPIQRDGSFSRLNSGGGLHNGNRRQSPRFTAVGVAELLKHEVNPSRTEAVLKDLSEVGCLVTSRHLVVPGTELKMLLNVSNCNLAVKGRVRHADLNFGLGIEFREIRKGDRQILQFLLRRLAEEETAQKPRAKVAIAGI
jgi:hypothetical protein